MALVVFLILSTCHLLYNKAVYINKYLESKQYSSVEQLHCNSYYNNINLL